jgi:hypothetical protein
MRWFGNLAQAEKTGVEASGRIFLPRGHRQLDVIDSDDAHVRFLRISV